MTDGEQTTRPTLRVISGTATPEEIAAILAIVAARSAVVAEQLDPTDTSTWADPGAAHRGVRTRYEASRHGWRTSYWPR